MHNVKIQKNKCKFFFKKKTTYVQAFSKKNKQGIEYPSTGNGRTLNQNDNVCQKVKRETQSSPWMKHLFGYLIIHDKVIIPKIIYIQETKKDRKE